MDLNNKVFFITGGAQGLGKAYGQAVLEKGGKVFFGDVNAKAGEETLKAFQEKFGSDRVKFKAFDVTNKDDFENAYKQAISDFGNIDVHVNNAGIMNEGVWELMIQINVTAVVRGTKLAVEHMRKDKGGKGGRIINISSVAGLGDYMFLSIYCGTKHAVRSYTTSLSKQPNTQALGIEYALLCPHAAATDLVTKLDETKIDFSGAMIEKMKAMAMPPEKVVEAFLQLVQLKNMNGAILTAENEGTFFKEMKCVEATSPDAASQL